MNVKVVLESLVSITDSESWRHMAATRIFTPDRCGLQLITRNLSKTNRR
jgi:hypothetical protein